MKEIKNWQSIFIDENGDEQIGILLPGCIIKGEIDNENVKIQVVDVVDPSNYVIKGANQEEYMLIAPNRQFLNNLSKCMEIGKNERDGEER